MPVQYPLGGMSETAADTIVLVCEQATQAERDHIIKNKIITTTMDHAARFASPCLMSSNEDFDIAIHEQRL